MTKRLFRTNISTFVAESVSDKARATKKRKVGRLDGCFDRNTNFFSRVRSARYDDRVAEIIRDRHLEEWLLFKDAEQRIYAQSSSSRQRVFHSSRRCFFLFFFLFPLLFFLFFLSRRRLYLKTYYADTRCFSSTSIRVRLIYRL